MNHYINGNEQQLLIRNWREGSIFLKWGDITKKEKNRERLLKHSITKMRRSSMVVIDFDFRAGGQGSIPT